MNKQHTKLHIYANLLGLMVISCILLGAFYEQLILKTLPCPLCLLQRVAFIATGLAMMLNLFDEIKPSHYGLMLLSSTVGFSVATRQILLHIVPHDTGYGQPFLGLHLYTWAAISFATVIILVSISLLFDQGFDKPTKNKLTWLAGWVFVGLIAANLLSTFLECGLKPCPDNPTRYELMN